MDEIGRGTSTFDGLSLAWAAARSIAGSVHALTLFATHYFELTSLPNELSTCRNVHLDATEHGDELVFLHTVKDGPANQSYGLHVARLAGVPDAVIQSAQQYLTQLEQSQVATAAAFSPQQSLPFEQPEFAARPDADSSSIDAAVASVTDMPASPDALRQRLAGVDSDDLTPRQALELIYELLELADPRQ